MKKRFLVFLTACFAVITLVGCTPTASSTSGVESVSSSTSTATSYVPPDFGGVALDICLNYYSGGKSMGVTYRPTTGYTNLDGTTYTQGMLLPTWKQFGTDLNVVIRDAADYSATSNDKQHTNVYRSLISASTQPFVSGGQNVDIYFNSAANMTEAATDGNLTALSDHLTEMPNLKAFFEANSSVYNQLKAADGKVYVAPYFDGKDSIEKMFIMNTEYVEKLLDAVVPTTEESTTITTAYTPQLTYGANEKIAVVGTDGQKDTILVNISENVIAKQNALDVKNGKNLTAALKSYLIDTYGEYVGPGLLYENYSEIFTSASACYNSDELVALMRCVKANPTYLTGTSTINVLFPRTTNAANRIENIMQFMSAWGVQGVTAEKDRLYFDADGTLQDARTTAKTYDGLDILHDIYTEGLIVNDYNAGAPTINYSQNSFKDGNGFMVYDYNATNTVYNQLDSNGNGTRGSKSMSVRPVLAPVTSWVNDDHTTYNFTRHTDDTRALKDGGWCVTKYADSPEVLAAALGLVDYMFSEQGANLQDYGPSAFVDGTITVAGQTFPKIKKAVFSAINSTTIGWNNWYRTYVGSTQGIGHVRSDGLDYQVTQAAGQEGLANIKTAMAAGVMSGTKTYGANGFNKSVPTFWSMSSSAAKDATKDVTALVTFWAQQAGNNNHNAVITGGYGATTRGDLEALFSESNTDYLGAYRANLSTMNY